MDAWINDPPSESEDESVPSNTQYITNNTQSLFSGDHQENYYHSSNLDSYGGEQKNRTYVELSTEEMDKKRESRKQSEKINPFYIKNSSKGKLTQKVYFFSHEL